MCTTADDSIQFLDFDSLFESAPTLTENTSITEDVDQNLSLLECLKEVSIQNESNTETINYKEEYIKIKRCLEEKDKVIEEKDKIIEEKDKVIEEKDKVIEEKSKDYDEVQEDNDLLHVQLQKLAEDYSKASEKIKNGGLQDIQLRTNFEKQTEELKLIYHKFNAIEEHCSVLNTMYQAALSQIKQFTHLVEKHESDSSKSKETIQSYKETVKARDKLISSLMNKLKTNEEGKLDRTTEKKNRGRETQRQITKCTKKKLNADLENVDTESVDTGRGSSFSIYSPAYSINFSPLNIYEKIELKMVTNASTSPLHTNETCDISELSIKSPSFDGRTSPVTQTTAMTRLFKPTAGKSPVVQTPEMTRLLKPTAVTSPVAQTPEIRTPFKPADVTSPVAPTPQISTPFKPTAMTSPVVQTPVMTRLLKPTAVTSPVAQTPEKRTPFKPADVTSPVVQTPEMTMPFKPAAVTSPVVRTPEMTRPFKPAAVTNSVVQTPEITRPFKPAAVTNSVVQTPEITRPLKSADVVERSTDKTPDMNRSLDPTVAPRPTSKILEMTIPLKPTAVTKHADLLTGPNETNDVKRQSLITKVSEMARHLETTDLVYQEAKTTTSEHVKNLVNNNLSVISKTPDLTQLHNAAYVRRSVIQSPSIPKYAAARRPLIKTKTPDKTKQNEHIKIFSSEKSQTKNFIEIQSHVAQDNNKERDDDLEVRMILNKFRLDWNALSPLSITPDLDEEGLVQSKSDVRNDGTERESLENSRSQISKESDTLLVITPDYKKLTNPQNQSNTLKHKINEDNPSHLFKNKVPELHSITPSGPTPACNENESQSSQTIYLRNRKTPVKIYENSIKSNNKMPESLSELASNISSLESQSDLHNIQYSESNFISRSSRNHMTQSQEPVKKEYLPKEKQIDSVVSKPLERRTPERIKATIPTAQCKTQSVPQTRTKLQSSPIDNMSISKEPQSIMHLSPERRRSERIKSTTPSPQSKTKSVPQTQTKLQSSPIDNMSISKEPQSIMHLSPERRRSERIKSTTPSPQSKTKLQSSPIDNMSISKEPQSIMHLSPERRRSERIKSTTPSPQSKTKSVPQTQTKLQSRLDNMSISKDPQFNTLKAPKRRISERIKSINMSISKEPQMNTLKPPQRRRSERIKSTNMSISKETQLNTLKAPKRRTSERIKSINMSISKEPQMNTLKPPKRRRSERIKSTNMSISKDPQLNTLKAPKRRTSQRIKSINMSISKEPQMKTLKPPKRRISERIKSTIPAAQSKTKSVPQTQTKLQSRLDNMSLSKEPQSNTRVTPIIRRSERIKSTTPTAQSNTRVPPVIRRSERIKSTTQSKRNSVPQAQMKLGSSTIDKMSISKEPQSNTHSSCAIISNPEYGRKRTICRSMDAQSDNQHSKRQKSSECDARELNSSEISSEDTFSFLEPSLKRISRVKGSVSTNTKSVPNNKESENISGREATETIIKDLSCTPASKRADLADYKTGILINPGQNTNENDNIKISVTHASTNTKNNHPEANLKSTTTASKRADLADDQTGILIKPGQNTNENDNINMSVTHTNTKNNHPEANLKSTTIAVPTWTTYKKNYPISEQSQNENRRFCADYSDIDIFNIHNNNLKTAMQTYEGHDFGTHNQLHEMTVQYASKRKKINQSKYECQIAKEIEKAVAACVNENANPNKYSETFQEAVAELQKHSDISTITRALYRYLNSSDRKQELVPGNKNRNYRLKPTPTKYVESLINIIDTIDKNGLKLWDRALNTCRFMLFRLDERATKHFDIAESVTHLFVNMCQYDGRRNPKFVMLFMLASMYCHNYRALIIVKDCLDLVPEILPHECQKEKILYSMNPLLQIFIFLLYFYNCKDQLGKVRNLRFTLRRKYGYDPTQENYDTILSKIKQTILEINDHYLDCSMLQYSILLLAKRKGTMWCHKNIVQKIILPIIRGKIYASKEAFRFCLTIVTKLVKPYRKGMIVHSVEVLNLLMDIIQQPHPQEIKEEIICGLMYLNMEHVIDRLNKFFDTWDTQSLSPKFQKAIRKYIKRNILQGCKPKHEQIAPPLHIK